MFGTSRAIDPLTRSDEIEAEQPLIGLFMNLPLVQQHNIQIVGNLAAKETLVFAHGLGSDCTVWRYVIPAFQERYRIVLFDSAGSTCLDNKEFDVLGYQTLADYADDLLNILDYIGVSSVTVIAHSVSCTIATLAALKQPELFKQLIFICGSPRYLDDGDYIGGFTKDRIAKMFEAISTNYTNWVRTYAPIVMNNPDKPCLTEEFAGCLLQLRPDIALILLSMALLSDYRQEFAQLKLPVLVLQAQDDLFVPSQVGEYLHRVIKNSELRWIETKGHFPHLTNPTEIVEAIEDYLRAPCLTQ